jgi:hypothetical protein
MTPSALLAEGLILKVPTQNDSSVSQGRSHHYSGRTGVQGLGDFGQGGRPPHPERLRQDRRLNGAAAALVAMEHRFVAWGEPPMDGATGCS